VSSSEPLETVETLPGLLEAQAVRRPKEIAIRVKRLGIWHELDWATVAEAVRATALAFDEAGVRAGDHVVVYASNDPRWLIADLGIETVRGVTVGLQPVQDPDELAANLSAAGARVIVCGDQQHVDNVVAVRDRIPLYEKLVVFELEGLHTPEYHDEPIVSFDVFRDSGRARQAQLPGRHAELLAAVGPDDASFVGFTAGTTGRPRGVVLSQRGQVGMGRLLAARIGARPSERGYSLLPLGHAATRSFDVVVPLVCGSSLNFPESHETIEADLAELAPTLLVATPRFFERVRATSEVRAGRAAWLKRAAYRFGMRLLEAALEARRKGSRARLSRSLGSALIGRWVLDKAGLLRLHYAGIGGAPVPDDLLEWFWRLGVPLHEQYGSVEAGGIAFTQRGLEDAGTAGPPIGPAVEARVGSDGELQLRAPGMLVSHFGADGDPGLAEGWYPTGDIASIDDAGRLVVHNRRGELLTTSGGDTVSATEVGRALERSPYVSTAVVVAEGRPFVSALIELQLDAVAGWAKRLAKPVTTYAALASDEDVRRLVADAVEAANAGLPDAARVRGFAVTPRPLDDELTATGTIQRDAVLERYAAAVEELYSASAAPVVA
jgi:long-chain acyl-CoA synthetase